jgi:hypothetical protein
MPQSMRLMENRAMGYTKEQSLEAANRKREQQLSLEIIKELRELTGEPFDKLETYLKEEIPADTFKVESKSVLYRKVSSVDNELKSERTNLLKEHEGELRIRIIDTIIKNDDKQEKMLRLLCSYEVRTRYFDYKKIDRNKPITKQSLMSHIENIQNQDLGFPIGSVLLTQKIMADVDSDISYWDITNKKEIKFKKFSGDDERIITIEQKNFPINKLGIEIDNAEKTTTVLSTLSDATQHYQRISKNRLKQHRKIVISKVARYKEIKAQFLDKMNDENQEHHDSNLSSLTSIEKVLAFGSVLGVATNFGSLPSIRSLFGLTKKVPMVYGMPLKIFQDLAEEIDREEAESLEDVETDEDVSL